MGSDDDLGRIDPDRLSLLQAAAKVGHVCHECRSPFSPRDQLYLMSVVEDYLQHRKRLATAKQGFTEGLEQACRMLGIGLEPLPDAPPPSVN